MVIFARRKKHSLVCESDKDKKPIFWICGVEGAGKKVLGEMLEKSSKYTKFDIDDMMIREADVGGFNTQIINDYIRKQTRPPDEVLLKALYESYTSTNIKSTGYLFVGFPNNLKQARLFEKMIAKVDIVIYLTLIMDALFARLIYQGVDFDFITCRTKYITNNKDLKDIYRKYFKKTIRIHSNFPPEDTCNKVIDTLDNLGYKFSNIP